MPGIFLTLVSIFFLGFASQSSPAQGGEANMKKTVMIIAQNGFKDEELLEPKEMLEHSGIEVLVASTTLGFAKSVGGKEVKPQLLVKDINVMDFDAIIFVGGSGATQYWNDPQAHKIAQDAYNSGRIVAAICIAPVTLAKAGILKGKRATVWSTDSGQLIVAGAKYSGNNVERDGKIITASGPFAAREFGEELVKALLY